MGNSIRSVVKVMNFHSLIRVDKSRRKSKKYGEMEGVLMEMIENILYNRNIMLDHKTLRVDSTKPELVIYIGSDMGFCANINTLVKKEMNTDQDSQMILIGRKLLAAKKRIPLHYMTRDAYDKNPEEVFKFVEDGIRNLSYSSISVVFNHFLNSSTSKLEKKVIFPLPPKRDAREFKEDFAIEGEPEQLLEDLVVLYAKYSLLIAATSSSAAENISRQNVTTESLHKLDERDEIELQQKRRAEKEKQFAKVLDNFTHSK